MQKLSPVNNFSKEMEQSTEASYPKSADMFAGERASSSCLMSSRVRLRRCAKPGNEKRKMGIFING